jgi:hypothetical protein
VVQRGKVAPVKIIAKTAWKNATVSKKKRGLKEFKITVKNNGESQANTKQTKPISRKREVGNYNSAKFIGTKHVNYLYNHEIVTEKYNNWKPHLSFPKG